MSNLPEQDFAEGGGMPPDDFHKHIERIREVADDDLVIPQDLEMRLVDAAAKDGLLVDQETLVAAASALLVGHLVLQGPPGTGKSSLARVLCEAFHCTAYLATAHAGWSTYEVIGRQTIVVNDEGKEEVTPVDGYFTEAVIRCANAIVRHEDRPEEPQATWLIIDELNRAHPDKAFGELFTVLGTDARTEITLAHQHRNNQALITPRRFRIIATINTLDRQFVNSLSQGLRRRFTFITVDIPPKRPADEVWTRDGQNASLANREFAQVIERAIDRIASRLTETSDQTAVLIERETIQGRLIPPVIEAIRKLFDLAEGVRYAAQDSRIPHVPIGTAQLIDTVELFLSRVIGGLTSPANPLLIIDWAASVKLASLFDADVISPEDLRRFADQLPPPFDQAMKRELLLIVAAGQYYIGRSEVGR